MIWIFLLAGLAAMAQYETPPDVMQFLHELAGDLANPCPEGPDACDAGAFLQHFDRAMPGYAEISSEVKELVARGGVGSAIEIASDSGDEKKRVMELDWTLEFTDQPQRRELIQCRIEKKGKKWEFVAFKPVDFFRY
ncbi:MAG TPA: hypothetical protein VKX39_06720 [Bryobacteraceae bacterium]|jgi:hypothetical protein|nr:hypothetical protein [Bryobacteraceae bacterium]